MAEQKAKVVNVDRGGPRGPRPKVQNPGKIFMRIQIGRASCRERV